MEKQSELIEIQPKFKETLVTNVEVFQKDTTQFYADYDTVWQIQPILMVCVTQCYATARSNGSGVVST